MSLDTAGSGYNLCVSTQGSGMCDTLQALGASDSSLALVGTGAIDPALLLGELTGVSAGGGASVGDTSVFSQSNPVQSSISDQVLGYVQETAESAGIGGIFDTSNLILYGIVALTLLLLIVWAYGGFKH